MGRARNASLAKRARSRTEATVVTEKILAADQSEQVVHGFANRQRSFARFFSRLGFEGPETIWMRGNEPFAGSCARETI